MYKIIGFSGVEETSMELCVPDMGVFFVNPDQNYPGRGILLKRAFHPPGGLRQFLQCDRIAYGKRRFQ